MIDLNHLDRQSPDVSSTVKVDPASVTSIQPNPVVLEKVKRTVELLSELHGMSPTTIMNKWLELGSLDSLKIELAAHPFTVNCN